MNRARDSSETSTARSVRGLDQPSSGGASEAPPRLCMDQSVPCTPSREVCATGWGARVRCKFEAAELLPLANNLLRAWEQVIDTCPVHCGHCNVEKSDSPIRDKVQMNVLSRFRPT